MSPHSVIAGDITTEDLTLWAKVVEIWSGLPSGLDCHEVCKEIVKQLPELMCVRGHFLGADHSWLMVKDRPKIIIDAYPWAVATGPFMITTEGALNPWRMAYQPFDPTKESGLRILLDAMARGHARAMKSIENPQG